MLVCFDVEIHSQKRGKIEVFLRQALLSIFKLDSNLTKVNFKFLGDYITKMRPSNSGAGGANYVLPVGENSKAGKEAADKGTRTSCMAS